MKKITKRKIVEQATAQNLNCFNDDFILTSNTMLSDSIFNSCNLSGSQIGPNEANSFVGCNLNSVVFGEMNDSSFQDCDLSGATLGNNGNMTNVTLNNVKLKGATISGVMTGVTLSGHIDFEDADLSGITGAFTITEGITFNFKGTIFGTQTLASLISGLAAYVDTDFSGADMTNVTMGEVTFDNCNFTVAIVGNLSPAEDCNFTGAKITGTMDGATIENCNFTDANFGATVVEALATINNSNFTNSLLSSGFGAGMALNGNNFTGADFGSCTLPALATYGNSFVNAKLDNCTFAEDDELDGDFTGASMKGIYPTTSLALTGNFTGADFEGTDLSDATFDAAGFYVDANFKSCTIGSSLLGDFSGASFESADLSSIDITGGTFTPSTSFKGATLTSAILTNEDLECIDLSGAQIGGSSSKAGVNMKFANMLGATIGGNFTGANFTGASMSGLIIQNSAVLADCMFQGIILNGVTLGTNLDIEGAVFRGSVGVTNAGLVAKALAKEEAYTFTGILGETVTVPAAEE